MATFKQIHVDGDLPINPWEIEDRVKSQISRSLSRDHIMINNGLLTAKKNSEDADNTDYIVGLNNGVFGAFTPGFACIEGSMYPCTIANTLNDGLVYADTDDNGESISLGKVCNACVIGTMDKATAILIPIDNYQAVLDGQKILEGLREEHEELIDKKAKIMIDSQLDNETEVKKNTRTITPIIWN